MRAFDFGFCDHPERFNPAQALKSARIRKQDRRVALCPPRACSVLERQLQLRERWRREGRIEHAQLFFDADGTPIRRHSQVYGRWRATLKQLAIRYRKPYAARHSSVSW
jgi:integrase